MAFSAFTVGCFLAFAAIGLLVAFFVLSGWGALLGLVPFGRPEAIGSLPGWGSALVLCVGMASLAWCLTPHRTEEPEYRPCVISICWFLFLVMPGLVGYMLANAQG